MPKRRYQVVLSRNTVQLLPSLDDYVEPNHPVRAIDVFVASLDLHKLGLAIPRKVRVRANLPMIRPSY